jgi:hypothetical protein
VRRRDNPAFLKDGLVPVFGNRLDTWTLHHERVGGQHHVGIAAIEHLKRLPDIFPKDNLGTEFGP